MKTRPNDRRQVRAVAMKPTTTNASPLAMAGTLARTPSACDCRLP